MRTAQANLQSGFPNTGEFQWTQGGVQTASIPSGIIAGAGLTAAPGAVNNGSDTMFFSGAGRLNKIIPAVALSGTAVVFYDGTGPLSGGPIYASGHKYLGVLPANTFNGNVALQGPLPIEVGAPFFSGLCAGVRSGCAGFTVTWTPETN